MDPPEIHVMAGVIRDALGRILLAQRPPGSHLEGLWEFPGGKREPGEAPFDALVRELDEELGIRVNTAQPLIGVPFAYPGKRIHLDVWQVQSYDGQPWSREGQSIRWIDEAKLGEYPMPAADHPVITALRLPPLYRITPDWPPERAAELAVAMERAFSEGAGLIRLRLPQWTVAATREFASALLPNARASGVSLLASDVDTARSCGLDGAHLSTVAAAQWGQRPLPKDRWFAMSCHDAAELAHAARIGADFVTLSPLQMTASHPQCTPLGWVRFAQLARNSTLPVYALGGLGPEALADARAHGAQGIAGIGRLWPA